MVDVPTEAARMPNNIRSERRRELTFGKFICISVKTERLVEY
jgi:hypothetical protein